MSDDRFDQYVGLNEAEYFDLWNRIKGMVGDRDVAMVILREMASDIRVNQLKCRKQRDRGPATDRQKAHMKKLGIEHGPNISFGQAREFIDRELERCV